MSTKIDMHGEVYGQAGYWIGHVSLIPTKRSSEPDRWEFKSKNVMETITIITPNRKRIEELIEKLYG